MGSPSREWTDRNYPRAVVRATSIEVSPVREAQDDNIVVTSYAGAQFWTVYVRDPRGLAEAIADRDTLLDAVLFATRININNLPIVLKEA